MFFDWLDSGRGALIDLPSCPRRLLEERKVLYLSREELAGCKDDHRECKRWAREEECKKNPTFMLKECRAACLQCRRQGRCSGCRSDCAS